MHRFDKWRHAIQVAPDQKTVGQIMSEYVAGILASDLSQLPMGCQAVLERPAADIQGAAVTLLQAELSYSGPPEVGAVLHEIAHTFSAASVRLGQLHGRAEPMPESKP